MQRVAKCIWAQVSQHWQKGLLKVVSSKISLIRHLVRVLISLLWFRTQLVRSVNKGLWLIKPKP